MKIRTLLVFPQLVRYGMRAPLAAATLLAAAGCEPPDPETLAREQAAAAESAKVWNERSQARMDSVRAHWRVEEETSPMDGRRSVEIWNGSVEGAGTLTVRCLDHRTDVVFVGIFPNTTEQAREARKPVRIRVDAAPAERETWEVGEKREALFAPRPVRLARRLAASDTFRIEFTPHGYGATVATFVTRNLRKELPRVAAACGWTL